MDIIQYSIRKLIAAIPLIIGVTLISFLLIVYFGPDQTYSLLGKNPTAEEIAELRSQLGYDQPFITRYLQYLREIVTLDFGSSQASDEKVSSILARTIPVSLALSLPGFILGNLLGVMLALVGLGVNAIILEDVIVNSVGCCVSSGGMLLIVGAFAALGTKSARQRVSNMNDLRQNIDLLLYQIDHRLKMAGVAA